MIENKVGTAVLLVPRREVFVENTFVIVTGFEAVRVREPTASDGWTVVN